MSESDGLPLIGLCVLWILVVLLSIIMFSKFVKYDMITENEGQEIASILTASAVLGFYFGVEGVRRMLYGIIDDFSIDWIVSISGTIFIGAMTYGNIQSASGEVTLHLVVGTGVTVLVLLPLIRHTEFASELNEKYDLPIAILKDSK